MLRRPLAAFMASLSAFAAVTVPLAGSADAAGTCTFTPPARIAIYRHLTIGDADIRGACRPSGRAYWITAGRGLQASAQLDAGLVEYYVPDDLDGVGVKKWTASGASSNRSCQGEHCDDLTQNEPYSDIRFGTYAAIAGTRSSASRVTFTVTSAIWSGAAHRLVNRPMKGELQTQYADGTWHKVGSTITTSSNGKATFAVGLPQRIWRFGVYSTARSFDRVSTAITR